MRSCRTSRASLSAALASPRSWVVDARPEPRGGTPEQQAAHHVARIVDAEGDAGRGDRGVQGRERGPTEGTDPEVALGHAREHREDRGMARGPGRPVWL